MPRKYVKKTSGPNYTTDDLLRAVQDIVNRNHTYNEVEEIYGILKSVVFNRIKGRLNSIDKVGAGRSTALSKRGEYELENCIKAKARMGYPCDKEEIKNIVVEYVKYNNLSTPFESGMPGDDWYYGFMKRHSTLSFKKPELLQKARTDARDPEVIYEFYHEQGTLIRNNNLEDKPLLIFNTDESGFCTDPERLEAVGEKGKGLVSITGGSAKESITVLATFPANGLCLPPLIVFKVAAVQARWTSTDAYPGTLYTTSANGWMEEPQFFEWFICGFVPHVDHVRETQNLQQYPAVLMLDGHNSHISYRIVKSALDNNIHLLKFPSHLTDKIESLDKCVFGKVKTNWEKELISLSKKQQRSDVFQNTNSSNYWGFYGQSL